MERFRPGESSSARAVAGVDTTQALVPKEKGKRVRTAILMPNKCVKGTNPKPYHRFVALHTDQCVFKPKVDMGFCSH